MNRWRLKWYLNLLTAIKLKRKGYKKWEREREREKRCKTQDKLDLLIEFWPANIWPTDWWNHWYFIYFWMSSIYSGVIIRTLFKKKKVRSGSKYGCYVFWPKNASLRMRSHGRKQWKAHENHKSVLIIMDRKPRVSVILSISEECFAF